MIKTIIILLLGIAFSGSIAYLITMGKRYEKDMFEDLPDMSDKIQR